MDIRNARAYLTLNQADPVRRAVVVPSFQPLIEMETFHYSSRLASLGNALTLDAREPQSNGDFTQDPFALNSK